MSGAATLPRYNSVPWSAGTWNDCVKSSKSALRWDIKNSLKSMCKRLTEIGEECFIVTANIHNGWVGHIGTLKGDEYIEDRSQILWDFLKYCRESECLDTSTNSSTDESEGEDKTKEETDESTETDEWEPDNWVSTPIQTDRSLRSCDQPKVSELMQTVKAPEQVVPSPDKLKGTRQGNLLGKKKISTRLQNTLSRSRQQRQGSYQSPIKRQTSYLNSRRSSLRSSRNSRDGNLLKVDLKFLTKRQQRKRNQVKQCSECCQVFKHECLYKKHMMSNHRKKPKHQLIQCYKCKREFKLKRMLYKHLPNCKKTK